MGTLQAKRQHPRRLFFSPAWVVLRRNIPGSSLESRRLLFTNIPQSLHSQGEYNLPLIMAPAGAFLLAGLELVVRLAPQEAMKAGHRLPAAASGKARYYMLWLGTLAGGEIVTPRPRSSCGGRLIAAPVTRPSSVPVARHFLLPESSLFSKLRARTNSPRRLAVT